MLELLRYKAELIRLEDGNDADGEACIGEAVEAARSRNAKSRELHADPNLAWLERDRRRPVSGGSILAPVYDWFVEGFGTADLKDAKALLDELS